MLTRQGTRIRDAYATPGETLLVHAGRLSPEKKPQRSLNTLATLRANGLPARLVVAGDGPLRRRLERRATRDRLPVTFAGFLPDRTDLAALLASADVAIAPGPAETFGLAGLEALACGTPVVVSAESALPEVVGEAGAAVAGEDLSAGVTTVLSWPEAARRAASPGPRRTLRLARGRASLPRHPRGRYGRRGGKSRPGAGRDGGRDWRENHRDR